MPPAITTGPWVPPRRQALDRNGIARVAAGDLLIKPELAEAVREIVGSAESPHTRRAYAAQATKFEAWCQRRGAKALPASPAVVATYLVDLAKTGANPHMPAKGAKVATVRLALSAIAAA